MGLIHQHGLNRAIVLHLRERFPNVQVDLKFDGYEIPNTRPLIVVEPMPNNNQILAKQRESIETIYRYQVGLYESNSVDLSIKQERLQHVFNFDRFAFYNTLQSPPNLTGYFYCELLAVVPMPAQVITKKSEYHRVYFDVEITDIKRRC